MIAIHPRFFAAAIGVAALIAVPVLARTVHLHTPAASHTQSAAAKTTGGVLPSQSKAEQLRRGVVCDADGIGSNCLALPD